MQSSPILNPMLAICTLGFALLSAPPSANQFAETYVATELTRRSGSTITSTSYAKTSIRASLQFKFGPLRVTRSTPYKLELGSWVCEGKLGDDSEFRSGRKQANLEHQEELTESVRRTLSTITLDWKGPLVSVQVSGKPTDESVIAHAFANDPPGAFDGSVVSRLTLGTKTVAIRIPFSGVVSEYRQADATETRITQRVVIGPSKG